MSKETLVGCLGLFFLIFVFLTFFNSIVSNESAANEIIPTSGIHSIAADNALIGSINFQELNSKVFSSNLAINNNIDISLRNIFLCKDFAKYNSLSSLDCENKTLYDRLKFALILENCGIVLLGAENAKLVAQKLYKLAENDQFTFFRGVDELFDYNMMCSQEPEAYEKELEVIPHVISNGDSHPENFGVMVMVNDKLVWGVNDFDQSFSAPFTWDLKRGSTGFLVSCLAGNYDVFFCLQVATKFIQGYLSFFEKYQTCEVPNQDRFIEGSSLMKQPKFKIIQNLFEDSRDKERRKKTKKWLEKRGIDWKKNKFFETDLVKPFSSFMTKEKYKVELELVQDAITAYLYHGTPAAAKFPNSNGFFDVEDIAIKYGSGTGSVGLNRFYVLIKGRRTENEELGVILLEMKEQTSSVLEAYFDYYVPPDQAAKRVVDGETAAFPYANVFYGWTRYKGNPYIIREKSKHQTSVSVADLYDVESYNELKAAIEANANGNENDKLPDNHLDIGFNHKFYDFINETNMHEQDAYVSISHKGVSKRVFIEFRKQALMAIEAESKDELTSKQKDYGHYAEASGMALAFYHARVRCPDWKCSLDDDAFADYVTCGKIRDYLRSMKKGELYEAVLEFAIAEAMREGHSWKLLKQLVEQKIRQGRSVLELLIS